MTLLVPQPEGIPLPSPSELSRPYWEALAAGELRFQRCGACGAATHTPAVMCIALTTLADAGVADGGLDVAGDPHELAAAVGVEGPVDGVRGHPGMMHRWNWD